MTIISTIATSVIPVFSIIACGYIYGRFRKLPARELTDLLIWIMIPCLVLGKIGALPLSLEELSKIGAAAALIILGCGLVSLLVFHKSSYKRAALLPSMFMNSANMAFPLAWFAYGDKALARQLIFYIAVNLLHVTLGIWIAHGKKGLSEVFRLPLVYAAILAISLAASKTVIPKEIAKALDLVGHATIPIMLLLLGARLRTVTLKHIWPSVTASAVRLGAGFAFGLLFVWIFELTGYARIAVLIGSAMPAAVLNFVFCEKYNLRPDFVATSVVISTLFSFVTTPLALWYIAAF
jgi:predicted permease